MLDIFSDEVVVQSKVFHLGVEHGVCTNICRIGVSSRDGVTKFLEQVCQPNYFGSGICYGPILASVEERARVRCFREAQEIGFLPR